ncbi:MAG: (2Fe-2S)-binding protein [Rhodospirillaceae bacterium]|nr:(2Fe-2S)-binding protein [Rhodospirillaceae bacterium]
MITLTVNGRAVEVDDSDPSTPLLWVLRDTLDLVGTKYGCGVGQCGACTVHINNVPMRSCSTPISAAAGQRITTIEGLAKDDGTLTAVQKAWIDLDVAQCGYCQAGQIMTATALLRKNPKPTDEQINTAMFGNLCRCGTYIRIKQAINAASESIAKGGVA